MADDLYIAGDTADSMALEQKRIISIASGDTPGIVPQTPSKKAIDKLNSTVKKADQEAKSKKTRPNVELTAYAAAAWRDADYCICGRKFMRVLGLAGKGNAAGMRSIGLASIKVAKDKS